jgi:hypothetical protein
MIVPMLVDKDNNPVKTILTLQICGNTPKTSQNVSQRNPRVH